MSYTVVVTVGRNIGRTPMPDNQWLLFNQAVLDELNTQSAQLLCNPVINPGTVAGGIGVWDGQAEDCAVFVATIATTSQVARLRERLKLVKRAYSQDAIGFIELAGTNHLV